MFGLCVRFFGFFWVNWGLLGGGMVAIVDGVQGSGGVGGAMRVLYLHGFGSSPDSLKARAVVDFCALHGLAAPIVPQLPVSPKAAMALCEALMVEHGVTAVCGSSLGGFYALYLAQKFGVRCALINPALTPWVDVQRSDNRVRYAVDSLSVAKDVEDVAMDVVGSVGTGSGAVSELAAESEFDRLLAELRAFAVPMPQYLERCVLLVGMDDEVLDATQAVGVLQGATQWLVAGGDHQLADFGGYLPQLMSFLQSGV